MVERQSVRFSVDTALPQVAFTQAVDQHIVGVCADAGAGVSVAAATSRALNSSALVNGNANAILFDQAKLAVAGPRGCVTC